MTTSTIVRDSGHSDDPRAKSVLRPRLLAQRRDLAAADKAAAEALICTRLLDWLQAHPVASLAVYHPIRQEPDLYPAYNALHAQGVHLSLPIIRGSDLPLGFVRWIPGEPLVKDAMGTSAPASHVPAQPQALLIPCLGFNNARIRLGYGGGFYDRTLAGLQPRPLAIGIAYADALVDFAGQAHDMALDLIITGP